MCSCVTSGTHCCSSSTKQDECVGILVHYLTNPNVSPGNRSSILTTHTLESCVVEMVTREPELVLPVTQQAYHFRGFLGTVQNTVLCWTSFIGWYVMY
jgi:hypothetical protein